MRGATRKVPSLAQQARFVARMSDSDRFVLRALHAYNRIDDLAPGDVRTVFELLHFGLVVTRCAGEELLFLLTPAGERILRAEAA